MTPSISCESVSTYGHVEFSTETLRITPVNMKAHVCVHTFAASHPLHLLNIDASRCVLLLGFGNDDAQYTTLQACLDIV